MFKKHDPSHPFSYSFVDQQFTRKFTAISVVNQLATIFAFLALLITSLGLLGLAAFTAEQRTKEIGIRKIMGASVPGLVAMIAKEFSWLVVIAFLIAAPISWWSFNEFLQRFTYRIDFPVWVILVSGVVTLVLALAIVCFQALKAASGNPVNSLRNE